MAATLPENVVYEIWTRRDGAIWRRHGDRYWHEREQAEDQADVWKAEEVERAQWEMRKVRNQFRVVKVTESREFLL